MTATSARAIVDEVFSRGMTREIWTNNYDKALPVSVQGFDLTAVLPAVFYMFRFGQRRGKGKFLETFGSTTGTPRERRKTATIERIANTLAERNTFVGFDGEVEKAILGDLFLCFCLENARRALGRKEQVQRVAPAHYMASWVDLPDDVAHLRYIPEMIVAMLANQQEEFIQHNRDGDRTWFAVVRGCERNVLIRAFHQGVMQRGKLGNRTSDQFKEETSVGLDQLLMIRLAQQLGAAPDKLRGGQGERISNQRPIAEKAAREFSEDSRRFVRSYADIMPRHAFVELLESCIAIGMTTILTSAVEILFEWAETGEIRQSGEQEPACLFVDCSNGVDRGLRALAEQSLDDFMRRIERFPVILMVLRLLDRGARYDPKIKGLDIPTKPYATTWLNMLGELLHDRRAEAQPILYDMARKAEELAEKLEEDYPEAAQMLRNTQSQPNPVWRLAESLISLQGRQSTQNLIALLDSSLLISRPNGLALKRTVRRNIRSLVFTDAVLDYLVHLHILPGGYRSGVRPLSFKGFIHTLRNRYGFFVDVAPRGITVSNDLLQANRAILERRLRDLGLLVGVNDAEAMKRLLPRFEPTTEDEHEVD
ncbi:hypothetical protein NKDENANG_02825 [Candidatus Entotheonellaceae bacterium PAL068K]